MAESSGGNNEWFPFENEYNPGITLSNWEELVRDESIFTKNSLITFACIQNAVSATCAGMAKQYGRSANFYNTNVWQTGKRIAEKLSIPLAVRETGNEKYWPVCCLGRYTADGFEYKIRPELEAALNRTGVLRGVKVMEEKDRFSWIPFYTELAEKILTYKDKRKELTDIVYEVGELVGYLHNAKQQKFEELHPFAVFGLFNRSLTKENRKRILLHFKDKLKLNSEIPADFDGIPLLNNQNSFWGLPYHETADKSVVDENWELFETALAGNFNENLFCENFDRVRKQSAAKWTVSMGLFWISPYRFMTLDKKSRTYLEKLGIKFFQEKDYNGRNYLDLLNQIKNFIAGGKIKEQNFPEISQSAWEVGNDTIGDITMDIISTDDILSKYTSLLTHTHNLIFHGAPGTGKTHLAKEIAKAMGAETAFVQFHPSYDYTDFVEGLRPVPQDDAGQIGFELRDGVFKEFCKRALLSKNISSDELKLLRSSPNVWKVSLEGTGDNPTRKDCLENGWIRIGWDSYGDVEDFNDFENFFEGGKQILRSFQHEMQCGDIVLSCYSAKEIDAIGIVTGEYEYRNVDRAYHRYRTVKWLVKNIRENIVELNHGKTMTLSTIYKLKIAVNDILDIVKKYSTNTNVNNTDKFVFIIDEINRGDLSKIFGELFFCIDPGYRGEKGMSQTQYQNLIPENDLFYKGFFVPENVYIIGTMNDIDRSVETMDFAFRRRFTFVEIQASDRVAMFEEITDDTIRQQALDKMKAVNAIISETEGLSSAYHIGGAYFLKLKTLDNDFEKLWEYHLAPLIKEYLRGTENEAEAFEKIKKAYDAPSDDFRARDSAQDAE